MDRAIKQIPMEEPQEKFYKDLDDETAAKHVSAPMNDADAGLFTLLTYEAYRDVPTTFLFCGYGRCSW